MSALDSDIKWMEYRLQNVTSEIERKRADWFTENEKESK